MKRILILSAILIFSCSSDDSSNNPQNDSIIGTWKLHNIQAFNQNDELLVDFISGTDCFYMSECQFNSDYFVYTDSTYSAFTFWEDDGADCQNGEIMEFDGCTNVFITTANYNLNNSVINYSNSLTENLICNETVEIEDGSVPFSIENDILRLYQQLPFECLDGLDYYTVITYQK
jgi:hypothetical protein